MEAGDIVAFNGPDIRGEATLWQGHLRLWIFRFGIILRYPAKIIVKDIDRFGTLTADGYCMDKSNFRPYRWWYILLWR